MARWAATGMTILLACATWSETIATPGWVVGRTFSQQVIVSGAVRGVTLERCIFDAAVTAEAENSAALIVGTQAADVWIMDCTFTGRSFVGVLVRAGARDVHVLDCRVLGTSSPSAFSYGIRFSGGGGVMEVARCRIADTGSHGVYLEGLSRRGDRYWIHDNRYERCGQAAVAARKTRGADGVGGTGLIEWESMIEADRNGPGGGVMSSCAAHFNNGRAGETNPSQPYIAWTLQHCRIERSRSPLMLHNEDSGGVAIDFGAHGVQVLHNVIVNNDGKGVYALNASRFRIAGNVIVGNDSGIVVSRNDSRETCDDGVIENNILARNYNGDEYGPGYNAEIFIWNTRNLIVRGNLYLPEPGRSGIRDFGGNVGLTLQDNRDWSQPWTPPAPQIVETIVERRVSRDVRLVGAIMAIDAETGEILGRVAPAPLESGGQTAREMESNLILK